LLAPQIRWSEWFRGLAQRNKGRKTSYFDAILMLRMAREI
jgi:hypothetical protein